MKKVILLLLSVMIGSQVIAQNDQYYTQIQNTKINVEQRWESFELGDDYEGSPYANDNFLKGVIFKGEEVLSNNANLRYNALSDEIELKNNPDSDQYSALIKDPDIIAKIFDQTYVFVPFNGSSDQGGYFRVLTQGDYYDLYKKTTAVYKEAVPAKTSYSKDQPARFIKNEEYYLVDKSGRFYELPSRRSKFLKTLGKKEKEVKNFIKDNNLEVDEEQDLVKIINHFNSVI